MKQQAATPSARPNYGVDAPHVIRNLFIVSFAGLSAWLIAVITRSYGIAVPKPLLVAAGIAFNVSVLCILMGIWIIWDSKVGKFRHRDRLIGLVNWKGSERVLDIGCGRGLLVIAAAKKLSTGSATGIDIWQSEDLTGNGADGARENAALEGVGDRVSIETADMRNIPFPDRTFDVVLSRAAIHNIYNAADRKRAISEIARVLKPGGEAVIDDIRHLGAYLREFANRGCTESRTIRSWFAFVVLFIATFGTLRPATIVVRKAASRG